MKTLFIVGKEEHWIDVSLTLAEITLLVASLQREFRRDSWHNFWSQIAIAALCGVIMDDPPVDYSWLLQ